MRGDAVDAKLPGLWSFDILNMWIVVRLNDVYDDKIELEGLDK